MRVGSLEIGVIAFEGQDQRAFFVDIGDAFFEELLLTGWAQEEAVVLVTFGERPEGFNDWIVGRDGVFKNNTANKFGCNENVSYYVFLSQKKKNTRDLVPSILVVIGAQVSQSLQVRWFHQQERRRVHGRAPFQQTPLLGFQRRQTSDCVLS